MSFFGFFIRFSLVYALVMIAIGVSFTLLGFEQYASHFNTPALLGIAVWCFTLYSTKNSRIVEGAEKWTLVLLAVLADIVVNVLLSIPTIVAEALPLKILLFGMAFVIPMHGLFLAILPYFVKKKLLKNNPDLKES